MIEAVRTVEAQYATELRGYRDMTDDQQYQSNWAISRRDSQRVVTGMAKQRVDWARSIREWERDAVTTAVQQAVFDLLNQMLGSTTTLDGLAVTVSLHDLVATATATVPTEKENR